MNPQQDSWSEMGQLIATFKNALSKCKAVNVNTTRIKDEARAMVQHYFRQARVEAQHIGMTNQQLELLDDGFQNLLKLINGNNPVRRYKAEVAAILSAKTGLDTELERLVGQSLVKTTTKASEIDGHDGKILETLDQVVPTAGLSYRQACLDLAAQDRLSYRGTANEFREALRELLDHLAPDKNVETQPGFKFEDKQIKPTMKQKVRFILRARGLPATSSETPESAVVLVDELIGKLTRSTYNRSSISAHVSTTRGEVCQMKMYVDSVLAELLEIHRER